jgi:hypothetical protein
MQTDVAPPAAALYIWAEGVFQGIGTCRESVGTLLRVCILFLERTSMRRLLIAAAILVATVSSWAQAYDPKIAYVQSSRNLASIVLANQDGGKAATVYSSRRPISGVDFAPGGGRIAFSEFGTLKVLAYTASSSGIVVGSVTTLASSAGDPDFSPDGSQIIYVFSGDATTTSQVRVISASGEPYTVLMPNMSGLRKVVWAKSGTSFFYVRQYESDLRIEIRRADLVGGSVVSDTLLLTSLSGAFGEIDEIDVARTKDSLLLTLNHPTDIRATEYNLSTGLLTEHVSGALRARFSSDDSKVLFIDLQRQFVNSFDLVSRTTTRLTKRGDFGWVDTRP